MFLFLSVRGPSLYVRIWRLQTSESDVYRRQILTYKDGPRSERLTTKQGTQSSNTTKKPLKTGAANSQKRWSILALCLGESRKFSRRKPCIWTKKANKNIDVAICFQAAVSSEFFSHFLVAPFAGWGAVESFRPQRLFPWRQDRMLKFTYISDLLHLSLWLFDCRKEWNLWEH